jgi:lysyl-tRNA synthetase class 2
MSGPRAAAADWRPTAGREVLALRAALLARLRRFFEARGVLEVDTPALSAGATTDPQIESIRAVAGGRTRYLHTSPEFAMKRLIAAGSGDIYQVCKVFRDGECGSRHNPEFTLLEWYRLGIDHHALMGEVTELLRELLGADRVDPPQRMTFREAVERHAGIDPWVADAPAFARCLEDAGVPVPADHDPEQLLDLVLGEIVGPALGHRGAAFVHDYPASRAALARVRPGDPPLAERFECYVGGMEVANGFHELADADEQRARFEHDLRERERLGRPAVPYDARLIAALASGLPACAGVAVGFDRLVMLAAGASRIEEVIAFPADRA